MLLSAVTVVAFASRWQMVFYTGSASHVVLSAGLSVSLRSSMHIKIDMAFPKLWSCGWSILYVSSSLSLHDSLHSLFTPVCLSVTRQGASHVLKGIPQRVIPSSQGWGVRLFHLDITRFFFAPFCFKLLFCFCTSSRKEHDQPRPMAM